MQPNDIISRCLVVLVAAAVLSSCAEVSQPLADTKASCSTATDCKGCIAKKDCAWCIPNDIMQEARCLQSSDTQSCLGKILDPVSEVVASTSQATPADYTVALTPHNVKLDLRVGESIEVPLVLDISKDQWLDLYYLTDISKSMQDDLDFLRRVGQELEEELSTLTSKFNIGFGTFIDKKMMPFFDADSQYESEPTQECHKTYGFCNALSLTAEGGEDFNAAVQQAGVGSNKDLPEGGMDALMQVLVCTEAIRWRKEARKLVLYASDDNFHFAGDGKMAGIDKINDGKCHLNKDNQWYTHSTLQDYPSVAQIANAAKSGDIYVIFAVTAQHIKLYQELEKLILGSKSAVLETDSSNIKDIIVEQFKKIVSTMELVADYPKESLKVDLKYNCPNGNSESCEGIEAGDKYDVTVAVTLLECPKNVTAPQQVVISSTSLLNQVTLDLNYLCSCDCEKSSDLDSASCGGIGNYSCGQCSCPAGFSGNNCECKKDSLHGDAACISHNSTAGVCSNRGECVCDKCVCDTIGDGTGDKYQGEYCECSNFECKKVGGELCGGHGRCDCSTCQCNEGWTGDDCSCSSSMDNCYREGTPGEEVCSGHGQCVCNSCKCNNKLEQGHRYIGKYCHDCETCQTCQSLDPCVTCHLASTEGDGSEEEDSQRCISSKECAQFNIVVRKVSSSEKADMSYCEGKLPDDCSRPFYFRTDNGSTMVIVSTKKSCPTPWWVILLSVIGAVVAVGLLTLVIFLLVNNHKEAMRMKAHNLEVDNAWKSPYENRMYKNPVSENKNPLYGRDM